VPIISSKSFKTPIIQFNGHLQTIIPSFFRTWEYEPYERERIFTPDEDFLDLDWLKSDSKKLIVISHGLEGDSKRHYVLGAAQLFHENGWEVLAWNCRSCSGELNLQPRFYHHGDTPDLAFVINHALSQKEYDEVFLLGFSMGGSLTLRYMGETGENGHKQIKRAMAVSVPCYLPDCVTELEKPRKMFYNKRFYKKLKEKLVAKAKIMPDKIDVSQLESQKISSCRRMDDLYFAPLHGYPNSEVFYDQISSWYFLDKIRKPTLLLNAQNDPFLANRCYPTEIAKQNEAFLMETPKQGGHVGFCVAGDKHTYAERRALEFAEGGR
jgi:predicted alpha/beta-fold hydrolase